MSDYLYTQTWFMDSELKRLLLEIANPDHIYRILEIGCFEGISSVFFARNKKEIKLFFCPFFLPS